VKEFLVTSFHQKLGFTTSTFGPVARIEIGAKDLIGS